MKYVAVLYVGNDASTFISGFNGTSMPGPARESSEGITFFCSPTINMQGQLSFFKETNELVIKEKACKLAAAIIPGNPLHTYTIEECDHFLEEMKKISPDIKTALIGSKKAEWRSSPFLDSFIVREHLPEGTNLTAKIKDMLKIEPGYDTKVTYPESPLRDKVQQIRKKIVSPKP